MRRAARAPALRVAPLAMAAMAAMVAGAVAGPSVPRIVDDFEDAAAWTAAPASGVLMKLSAEPGPAGAGHCLRVDFDFQKGGGYAVLHRALDLELPENYRITFRVRGECQPQNLEFKLIDSTGANVWWQNRRDVAFPREWETFAIKRRQISFAWGPAGGGELRRAAALEFAVTAGSGGRGTVWLDDLELTPLPPPGAEPPPVVARASSGRPGREPRMAVDGRPATAWATSTGDKAPWLELDLGAEREFGGLLLDWDPAAFARDYTVEAGGEGGAWRTLREVRDGDGGRDWLYLPESEADRIRIRVRRGATPGRVALREARVMPLAWAPTLNDFYRAIAREAPRGSYPRPYAGEQCFWSVVGVNRDRREGLLSEDGMVETGKGSFSVEPFLFTGGKLVTWADVKAVQSLEQGHLPIPSVTWSRGSLELRVTAFATGDPGSSRLFVRYVVTNRGRLPARGTLHLALRPFQVNPPAQFLNDAGGVASIRSLALEGGTVRADGGRGLVCLTAPAAFGAATFDQGDIVESLRRGVLPARSKVEDPFGHASGALAYPFDLAPGAAREVGLEIPLYGLGPGDAGPSSDAAGRARLEGEWSGRAVPSWKEIAGRVTIALPETASAVEQALEAQLGWILVNRDSAAIQPGSRSYERSWIRDGSLTSSALLRLGQPGVVRDFIEWFAPYQYGDGKVPCCVDRRGSDPVPENDSHGEFIFLVADYHRITGDSVLVARMWPHVRAAAAYLDSLRRTHRTSAWQAPGQREFYGLLPPSISHEGYSAKPMHSYWDDLFALRGFKDAVYLAGVLGLAGEQARWSAARDEFQEDLVASVRAAMARHRIDYVPGCADLGDFDATSTTIALNPVQAEGVLPQEALRRTFEKYWEFFRDRRAGTLAWEAFTPYEMRCIGAFVRLGWRERANEALEFFLRYRDPPGWQQWAEVVWHDRRATKFIGDLPHTWVGSDFVRSVLDMLAWERESDQALVVAAGVPAAWVKQPPGVRVENLPTRWGPLGYTLRAMGGGYVLNADEGPRVPRGGIVVRAPDVTAAWRAEVNGAPAPVSPEGEVVIWRLPAKVVLTP